MHQCFVGMKVLAEIFSCIWRAHYQVELFLCQGQGNLCVGFRVLAARQSITPCKPKSGAPVPRCNALLPLGIDQCDKGGRRVAQECFQRKALFWDYYTKQNAYSDKHFDFFSFFPWYPDRSLIKPIAPRQNYASPYQAQHVARWSKPFRGTDKQNKMYDALAKTHS